MNGNTTVFGAGFGAALGAILIYLAEIFGRTDIPAGVEGSILVVVTALVAYIVPADSGEPPRDPHARA